MEDYKYQIGNMFINEEGYVISINNITKDINGTIFYRLNGIKCDCFAYEDYLDRLNQIVMIKK